MVHCLSHQGSCIIPGLLPNLEVRLAGPLRHDDAIDSHEYGEKFQCCERDPSIEPKPHSKTEFSHTRPLFTLSAANVPDIWREFSTAFHVIDSVVYNSCNPQDKTHRGYDKREAVSYVRQSTNLGSCH